MSSIGRGGGGGPQLNPRALRTHQRKLRSLQTQAANVKKALDELAKASPPTDPRERAKWDKAVEKLKSHANNVNKVGKGFENETKKAQKSMTGDDGKKFSKSLGKPAQTAAQQTKSVVKSAASFVKKASAKANPSSGGQTSASDSKAAMSQLEQASMQMMQLQQAMQKHQQTMQLMSNISKTAHETAMKTIRNLR